MVDGVRFRARPWCGTGERLGARLGVGVEGRSVRQAPAVAVAGGAAVLFPFEQGIAETGSGTAKVGFAAAWRTRTLVEG